MNTIAHFLSCDDHLIQVRVSYGCKGGYRYFNASHGQHKYCYVCAIDKSNIMITLMASIFTHADQQCWIKISIALLQGMTAAHQPRGFLH